MIENIKEQVGGLLNSPGVQGLKDSAAAGLSRVGEGLQGLKERAGEFAQSDELESALPYLLSGGAGALAGGLVTGRQREEKGEDRSAYLKRVLRNALVAGGLASGGHYLLNKGVESTVGSLADENALTGGTQTGEQGPLGALARNVAFSPLTAIGAGAAALKATHNSDIIGHGKPDVALKAFMKNTGTTLGADELRHLSSPGDIAALGGDDTLRQKAGLPSTKMRPGTEFLNKIPQGVLDRIPGVDGDVSKLKGGLSSLTRRAGRTFGQTHGRRAMRGSIGLAAAGVPALIGALLTDE
jgi:hypothetical protein